MTYLTCPIRRYHPLVAQKAATMQLLCDGRFTLGLGAGANLNEHMVGGWWPLAGVRHEMPAELQAVREESARAARRIGHWARRQPASACTPLDSNRWKRGRRLGQAKVARSATAGRDSLVC